MDDQNKVQSNPVAVFIRSYFRGIGQVMFQGSAWTGLLIMIGIFWGSYECHMPWVGYAGAVGCLASTIAGIIMGEKPADGEEGLWGFNGVLVGCGFATFLENNWYMWVTMIFFAMMSTWVRRGFNNVMAPWKVNSFTFPFVFLTWIMLFASFMLGNLKGPGLSHPELPAAAATFDLDMSFSSLVIYWLKGISQVFLVNSWVTGIFFLVALAVCNMWAAVWAAIGSAIPLALAILFQADPSDIANGLYGFSPVLTGIAIGMTFYKVNYKSALWAICGIIATFFIQVAMDIFFAPWGLATLTGPFCVTTWLFLLPTYKLAVDEPNHAEWHTAKK